MTPRAMLFTPSARNSGSTPLAVHRHTQLGICPAGKLEAAVSQAARAFDPLFLHVIRLRVNPLWP
jgi:hypothetical protein